LPLPTTGSSEIDKAIISLLFSVMTAWVIRALQPRARVVFYVPYESTFHIPQQNNPAFSVKTRALRIENIGRDTAEDVEVHHAFPPEHFKIVPTMANQVTVTPQNTHVITVPSLAPSEGFWIEMITANILPVLSNVRSRSGPARVVHIRIQRQFPKWFNVTAGGLFLLGLATLFYILLTIGKALIPGLS
jgi:hypothetical protein